MNNSGQQAFVQGVILDTVTGNIFVYNPLVVRGFFWGENAIETPTSIPSPLLP